MSSDSEIEKRRGKKKSSASRFENIESLVK